MQSGDNSTLNGTARVYYSKLTLGKYAKPSPFAVGTFTAGSTFILPLPLGGLRDDTSVAVSTTDLDTIGDLVNKDYKGVVAKTATNLIPGVAGAFLPGVIGGALKGSSSETVAALTPADKIASALQQAMGMAPNPNETITFDGPSLRSFQLTWTFNPRNASESAGLTAFIKTVKAASLPTNVVSGSTAILGYPDLAQLNFYPWDSSGNTQWGWGDNSIIKIKRCFMEGVSINYAPSNIPSFFSGTNQPVAIEVTISFKETEYMLSNDWGGTLGTEDTSTYLSQLANASTAPISGMKASELADAFTSTNTTANNVQIIYTNSGYTSSDLGNP